MNLPRFRAAVFDMDGTLVDNMHFHAEAWLELAAELGVHGLSKELFEQRYAGRKNEEIFPDLCGRPFSVDELSQRAHQKEQRYRDLARGKLEPMPGLVSLLEALARAGIPCAVASAAPRENRMFILDGLALAPHFVTVVGAEDVVRGKPNPDFFLKAAERLGVDPRDCVAFEDAVLGVQSAVAAGMTTVGVLTTTPAQLLLDAGATTTITSYADLPDVLARRL